MVKRNSASRGSKVKRENTSNGPGSDLRNEGSSSFGLRAYDALADYGDLPDPLLEEPLSPVFYNSIYGEDYGDSYGLLPPCEPVPSDSITQSTNVHCGSPVIVPDAPDVTNEDVVEGTSDGVAKDKTIVDEAQIRLRLSKQIEKLPDPYKRKMKALCQKYEKEQSDIKAKIEALTRSVDDNSDEILPPEERKRWLKQTEQVINDTLEKCFKLLLQLKKNTNKMRPDKDPEVLRRWLFSHFEKPYPTPEEKEELANQSGYTKKQVSNWFINARVRLWRPMVFQSANEIDKSKKSNRH